ncbi:hypothetical protein FB451DRAFT_1551556 [Mycena latifolia]|nr:hypothetical protein FB451DRAFT_1551556 [Mycena latifolia]
MSASLFTLSSYHHLALPSSLVAFAFNPSSNRPLDHPAQRLQPSPPPALPSTSPPPFKSKTPALDTLSDPFISCLKTFRLDDHSTRWAGSKECCASRAAEGRLCIGSALPMYRGESSALRGAQRKAV